MGARQQAIVAILGGSLVIGLFAGFAVALVVVSVSVVIAVATGVRAEGRAERPPFGLRPFPYVLAAVATTLFFLIGTLGFILGVIVFFGIAIAFFLFGGDLG